MPIYDQRGSEVMDRAECLARLASAAAARQIGRVAVCATGAPHVVPVDFAFVDQRVLVRTGPGFLATHAAGRLVAFEVDDLDVLGDGLRTGWSVLVRGLAVTLSVAEVASLGPRAPQPSVDRPGDRFLAIRPDAVTGRKVGRVLAAQGLGSA